MTPEEARARNRARWRRRRARRVAAALVFVPFLLLAALLASNTVRILGSPASAQQTREARTLETKIPELRYAEAPLRRPVVEVPRIPRLVSEYIPPGTYVSPRVKWEMARLMKMARAQSEMIVLEQRAITPDPLETIELALSPEQPPPLASLILEQPGWDPNQDFLELAPGDVTFGTATPPVPEPGTGLLVGAGLILLSARRRSLCLRAH